MSQSASPPVSVSPPNHRLIITADDYGYSQERDCGIVECFQGNAISGVVLMVNGETAETACSSARKHAIPVGLHLNLTEGCPVHKCDNTSLVNSDGFLRGKFGFRQALADGSVNLSDVKNEIAAQIDRFQKLMGILPTHMDGHQHVHVLPGVCQVFAETLAKYGIERTRLPIQPGLSSCRWLPSKQMQFFQQIEQQAAEARNVFHAHGIRHTSSFIGTSTMGAHMTMDHLQQAVLATMQNHLGNTSPLTFELMTHPGYCTSPGTGGCGDGPDDFAQSKDREHEIDILHSAEWQQVIAANKLGLCSYKDL